MSDRTEQLAREISVVMPKIARRIFMEFFQEIDITQTQIFAIMTLFEGAPCKLSEFSTKMKIAAPTATGIIDRLEKSGYVKRMPGKEDRRVVNVDLTPKGQKIAKKLIGTIKKNWQRVLLKLPMKDREDYLRILTKVEENL